VRPLVRYLARPPAAGATVAGWRRSALVALMPWLVRRHHVVDLLALLDSGRAGDGAPDARAVVDGLRRRPTTCLYRSLAAFAALRDAGADVRFVIGVRVEGGDVVAHAWIEERGEPVGEPHDPRDRFAVAFVHPPRAGDPGVARMADGVSSRDVILTEMKDGTGVLLDLRSKFYFTLNETGVAVWKLLASGEAATARALAERIARDFDAPSVEVVETDVKALLDELAAEGLLGEKSAP
jgi:hypothetical protein